MLNNNYNPRQNILAKILFFCITQAAPEKKPLPQFQCCWPQAPCSAWPRATLIIGGRGTFWFLPQFLPPDCLKNEKSKKKDRYYKHVHTKQILVIYYALWNKWPPPMTNACSWEEKQQIIQKETHNFMYNVTLLN